MQKRLYRIPKVEKPENARCSEPKFNIVETALERLVKYYDIEQVEQIEEEEEQILLTNGIYSMQNHKNKSI